MYEVITTHDRLNPSGEMYLFATCSWVTGPSTDAFVFVLVSRGASKSTSGSEFLKTDNALLLGTNSSDDARIENKNIGSGRANFCARCFPSSPFIHISGHSGSVRDRLGRCAKPPHHRIVSLPQLLMTCTSVTVRL